MKKMFKRTLSIVVIAVLALAMNIVVFAQGTTMIAVSKSSPAVGDSVTVSITASESGTITVKYTSSMLNFISCNASGYSASGNTVSFSGKSGDIVFSAGSAGTASIIVSSSSCSGSSTTLAIGGSGTAAQSEPAPEEQPAATEVTEAETPAEPEETPAEETTEAEAPVEATAAPASGAVGTLNADGGFDINGASYVVSERYSDSEMPSGFAKKTIQIGSSTYSEPTNGEITLLYLKPSDNIQGSGVFYLYNAESQTVSEFLMLDASNDLIILSSADSAPSSAFTQTALEVSGGTAVAYTVDGSQFFYVYGTNKAGNSGWFVYDSANGTVSRMDESLLSAATVSDSTATEDGSSAVNDSVDVYVNKLDTYRKVIMALIVLCVILVFIVINTLLKSRGKDDDDFDGDVFATRPSKPAKKMPRSIVFGSSSKKDYDEEEEYDDEEEYEEDEYEDEEEYDDDQSFSISESISSYEARRNSSLNMMDLNDL